MAIAIYPGSFDPVTFGHIDVIQRASLLCDKLIVGVLTNSAKTPMFTAEERVEMLQKAIAHLPNVSVEAFSGLTVDFAKKHQATMMVRGLRAVTDFEYELQLSQINRKIAPEVDTVFLTTSLQYAYLSSSIVKEVASYEGDIHEFVPGFVADAIYQKLKGLK